MSRNTLLFLCAMVAIVIGALVSYFPPSQNGVAIWSMVSMFVGYGIRDLFKGDAEPAVTLPTATDPTPATPAQTTTAQQ